MYTYKVLLPSGKILVTRDTMFDETQFPHKVLPPPLFPAIILFLPLLGGGTPYLPLLHLLLVRDPPLLLSLLIHLIYLLLIFPPVSPSSSYLSSYFLSSLAHSISHHMPFLLLSLPFLHLLRVLSTLSLLLYRYPYLLLLILWSQEPRLEFLSPKFF